MPPLRGGAGGEAPPAMAPALPSAGGFPGAGCNVAAPLSTSCHPHLPTLVFPTGPSAAWALHFSLNSDHFFGSQQLLALFLSMAQTCGVGQLSVAFEYHVRTR